MIAGFVLALILAQRAPQKQSYLGADEALRLTRAAPAQPAAPTEKSPAEEYWSAAERYLRRQAKLAPAESAKEWIALADRAETQSTAFALEDREQGPFGELMRVLPSPKVWPAIESHLLRGSLSGPTGSRRQAILATIEMLSGKSEKALADVQKLQGLTPEQQGVRAYIALDIALRTRDGRRIENAYVRLARDLSAKTQPIRGDKSLELSDLVSIVGRDRAISILKDVMAQFDGELGLSQNAPFAKLEREVALSVVGRMRHPQWSLALSSDGGPLFEAMHRRFPAVDRGISRSSEWAGDTYGAAATRYLFYLVAQGRSAGALAFANSQKESYWLANRPMDDEVQLLKDHGKLDDLAALLEALVRRGIETSALTLYAAYCEAAGLSDRKTQFLATLPKSARYDPSGVLSDRVDKLVTAHKVREAGELLVADLKSGRLERANGMSNPNSASELVDVGNFLHRADWIELGLSTGEKLARVDNIGDMNEGWVCRELAQDGRGAEAEQLLAEVLSGHLNNGSVSYPPQGSNEIKLLARLYSRLGRPRDVVTLLNEADWEEPDLASVGESDSGEPSFPLTAARALAAVGRTNDALRLALFLIDSDLDFDGAYELLLQVDPGGAEAILDGLQRAAPMNPRPVMWKAELLRRKRRLQQADTLIERAIAMDPEDTQDLYQSHTRFQAWEILSRIERAEGKTALAAVHERKFTGSHRFGYNGAVNGYHLDLVGEDASVVDNPDDFELQFDIADKLVQSGRRQDAEALMRKVCRRLPFEIGPASSLGWPDDARLDAMCEASLLKASQSARNPSSLFAALGSLYQQKDQIEKATAAEIKAVSLDPDCLLGWEILNNMLQQRTFTPDLQGKIAYNLYRLCDPHSVWLRPQVLDFAALWLVADRAWRNLPDVSLPVVRLRFSVPPSDPNYGNNVWSRNNRLPSTGGSAVAADPTITDLVSLASSLGPASNAP